MFWLSVYASTFWRSGAEESLKTQDKNLLFSVLFGPEVSDLDNTWLCDYDFIARQFSRPRLRNLSSWLCQMATEIVRFVTFRLFLVGLREKTVFMWTKL